MGSMLVTVLFWLTVGLIVAALVGEFRDTWTVTEQNTSGGHPDIASPLPPEQAERT